MGASDRFKDLRLGNLGGEPMSRKALADALGEKESKIQDIERRKQKLQEDLLVKVVEYFGVDANWLLLGVGSPYRQKNNTESELSSSDATSFTEAGGFIEKQYKSIDYIESERSDSIRTKVPIREQKIDNESELKKNEAGNPKKEQLASDSLSFSRPIEEQKTNSQSWAENQKNHSKTTQYKESDASDSNLTKRPIDAQKIGIELDALNAVLIAIQEWQIRHKVHIPPERMPLVIQSLVALCQGDPNKANEITPAVLQLVA